MNKHESSFHTSTLATNRSSLESKQTNTHTINQSINQSVNESTIKLVTLHNTANAQTQTMINISLPSTHI